MYSIYEFFANLISTKNLLVTAEKLRREYFDVEMSSAYRDSGIFPDVMLGLNNDDPDIQGGELIELHDCDDYTIPPFKSIIPTGTKDISKIFSPEDKLQRAMRQLGEDIEYLPIRNVFYLLRGRHSGNVKVCLVHGSFFETIPPTELIRKGFEQVLDETLPAGFDDKIKLALLEVFSKEENLSQIHNVEGASVTVRFDIMTEANSAGNILLYPEIQDNTLNFIVPSHNPEQDVVEQRRLRSALAQSEFDQLVIKRIKHPFSGEFQVFQIPL